VQSVHGTALEKLIMDFTEMPQAQGYKYLLVFMCTFSGWVEAFPTRIEKAQEVTRCLLKEIIPQVGIPVPIGLDNGPAFVAKVVQLMGKGLGISWQLHTTYHPHSSGKVEHTNRTLKLQLGKLRQETHLHWDQLLPIALLRVRPSPMKQTGFLPFEVLYERHSP
jgi:transposase InsO family protein